MKSTLSVFFPGLISVILVLITAGTANAQDRLSGEALINALRRGGYNIYFRHAATEWSQQDQVETAGDWTSCDPGKMRQLSQQGRAVANRIGEAIRRLQLPIGKVLSSQYCRTRETAEQMKLGPVKTTLQIMNMRVVNLVGGRETVIKRAQETLATEPAAGTNTVLVAHGNLLLAATGAYPGEAGAAIFLPLGDGKFQLVAELAAEEWEKLATQFSPDKQ